METKIKFKTQWIDVALILLLMGIPLFLMWIFDVEVVFFNSDDFYIEEVVSGYFTGVPQSHLVHIGYLAGLLLSRLYMIFPVVPWYGIFLFSMLYGSIMYAFSAMLLKLNKIRQKIIFLVCALYIICAFFFCHLIDIQYTTVTTVVCMAAVITFVLAEDKTNWKEYLKANIAGYIFFFLSFNIRDKACLMVLPIFFFIGVSKVIKDKKMFRSVMVYALGLIAIMFLLFGVERIAYSGEPWNEFERYNTAREQVMDYAGFPSYAENTELYEELGISEQSYISVTTRYQAILDENINLNFMETLESLADGPKETNISLMLYLFVYRHLSSPLDRPLNIIVYFIYISVIVLALISKKYSSLCDIMALFLGRMVIWTYLIYVNRSLPRVTQGIYIIELMFLFAVIIINSLWVDKKKESAKIPRVVGILIFIGIIAISHRWGISNTISACANNAERVRYASCYKEVREYCNQNADKLFMADTFGFIDYTDNIFEKTEKSQANLILLGAWMANSPWTDQIAERYNIESYEEAAIYQDNVYFIFVDDEKLPWQYLADYYAEKYPGSIMEVEDVIETAYGQKFLVLKVRMDS